MPGLAADVGTAPRPGHPVLIVNPVSGRGKAVRNDVVGWCRANGVEPVVLQPGDDVGRLAAEAVAGGADVLGMAGGDGSMGPVTTVAVHHDVPMVVVPAGTRNHFALDLGLSRRDVRGALRALVEGTERRVDLARVNGRIFVNNASMGLYGAIVRSQEYRDAKLRTVIDALPRLVGPGATPFDLRFTGPDGIARRDALVLLVSNDPYDPQPLGPSGTRGGLRQGTLGVVALGSGPPATAVQEWTATSFVVGSAGPLDVGLDGEALSMEPPLHFECLPGALRVRVPVGRRPRPPLPAPLTRGRAPSSG